jgi:membrane-associated phospholipid phosphatase
MAVMLKWFERLPLQSLRPYLSIHFLTGVGVSVLCFFIFYRLADNVVEQERIVHFDLDLANSLHAMATPTMTSLYMFITLFGQHIIWGIVIVVALIFGLRRDWWRLGIWLIAFLCGQLLNSLLKLLFIRDRPFFEQPLLIAQDYSFPSGHAMMSTIIYGMIAYYLVLRTQNGLLRILIVFASVLLVVLIGISRMYLGVHYFSDVIAGFAAGGIWLTTCISADTIIRHRRDTKAEQSV